MFNVLVNREYEMLFENLKTEAPDSFVLTLVDFNHPDENLQALLSHADAIIGQVNLSDSQFKSAGKLKIIQTLSAGYDKIDLEKAGQYKVRIANNDGEKCGFCGRTCFDADFRALSPVVVSSPFCNKWSLEKFETHKQGTFRKNPWYLWSGTRRQSTGAAGFSSGCKGPVF